MTTFYANMNDYI